MSKITRRRFIASTAAISAVGALPGCGTQAAPGGPRGNPFARVQDIPDNVRRIPSDKYPPPFSDQEYTDRLKKTRAKMSKLGIDLLYVTLPDAMCYLHGYEVTWYRAQSQKGWFPATATAVHVDHDQMLFLGGENVVPAWVKDRRPIRGGGTLEGSAAFVAAELQKEGWLKSGTRVGQEFWSYLPNRAVSEVFSKAFMDKGGKIVDGSDVMRQIRIVKSPVEVEAVEMAARIVDVGHRAIAHGFKPGMSHLEVYALATNAMYSAGGEVAGIAQE